MSKNTLYDKVIEAHTVGTLPNGQIQLFVGRHLVHEVTSPQAFEMLRERGLKVRHPELTFATLDHIIPTDYSGRPYKDEQAWLMAQTLEKNVKEFGITYFNPASGRNGVCHVTFPEQGVIWPGQIAVCGDSHTCTYGALGALAFGIGTTQVSHVLATQTVAIEKLKVRRINFTGELLDCATAKDAALELIRRTGVKGGLGFVYEYGGKAVSNMTMEERLTLCNMSVEGGARSGYVNPDNETIKFLRNREFTPHGKDFDDAIESWLDIASGASIVSNPNVEYDDMIDINSSNITPMVTWGVNPAQAIPVFEKVPKLDEIKDEEREEARDAMKYMGIEPGQYIEGTPVDVVFIGSCTNGRLSDLVEAAEIMRGRKVSVRTLVVPGSELVKSEAQRLGLDKIFRDAGAEWRAPGCSMCLAMNPDRLEGTERCASTSNRNFKGRQGSPTGRTHLMSPYTAAATAIEGRIANPRKYF